MSTHVFAYDPAVELYGAHFQIEAAVRSLAGYAADPIAGTVTLTFVPDLTPAEAAKLATAVADLARMAHFGLATTLTLAEYQAMKPSLADARTVKATIIPLRTRTLAQWNALTATQREADQLTYLNELADGLNDVVAVLEALLRDA